MAVYTIELDGKQYDIEGDREPTEEEARQAVADFSEPQQANIFQQLLKATQNTVGGIAGAVIQPPAKMVGRLGQSIESELSGQPPQNYSIPMPQYLGGNIPIEQPQNLAQAMGPALQTAALGLSPAMGGMAYGAGSALEEKQGAVGIAGQTLLGGLIGKAGGMIFGGEPLVRKTQKQLDLDLRQNLETSLSKLGVKPTSTEAPTATKVKRFFDKAETAVKSIFQAKDKIQYIDENGVTSTGLPKNIQQFGQAIDQTKKMIYEAYDSLTQQTTGQGVTISLSKTADDVLNSALKPEITDLHPEIQEYALKLAGALEKRRQYTPKEAQDFIKTANETLKNFYQTKHPDYVSKAYVESVAASSIRESLDSAIESSTGIQYQALKNQYGALTSIEKQVNRAMLTSKSKKMGLIDYFNVYNIGDITQGILTGNIPQVAKGAGRGLIAAGIKKLQSPDYITNNLFNKVSSAENYKRINEARSILGVLMRLKGESSYNPKNQ